MRPLDPQDRDAPVSAMRDAQAFWDHLGATRAEEYAQDDILPISAVPVAPALPPDTAADSLQGRALADVPRGSLEDTLQALDQPAPALSAADMPETSKMAMAAALEEPVTPAPMDGPAPTQTPLTAARPRKPAAPTRRSRFAGGRIGYRMQRIWLTPAYRLLIKYGLPVLALGAALGFHLSDEANRTALAEKADTVYSAVVDRPEFMVTELQWPEVTPELDAALRDRLELELPQSSFRLDLDALRQEVEALDWVRSADLRLLSDGVLGLSITERVPAILWRSEKGLQLLDTEGVRVAHVTRRDLRPDLPLIAGTGANEHIREAFDLLDAASPLGDRVLGLLRVGERRWDVVLDRDQRIRLPEKGALPALERAMALHQAQDLLARDLVVADLRNPARPVLQISAGAMESLRDIRSQSPEFSQ